MDRRLLWGAGGGLVLLLAVGVGIVPRLAMGRVHRMAAAYGLEVDASGMPFGLSGLSVPKMSVRSKAGGLTMELSGVSVRVNALSAMSSVRGAVRSVSLDGASIVVDASNPGFTQSLQDIFHARKGSGGGAGSEVAVLPKVDVEDVALTVKDRDGPLVLVTGLWMKGDGTEWEGGAKRVQVGLPSGDQALLTDLHWTGKTQGGRVVLDAMEAAGGQMVLSRHDSDAAKERSTRDRLFDLRDRVRRARGPRTADDREKRPSRFAEGFVAKLDGINVVAQDKGGEAPILSGLAAQVADADDHWSLKGSGKPQHGGKLQWDFAVWPRDLRASGSLSFDQLPLTLLTPFLPKFPWHEPSRASVSGDLLLTSEGATSTKFSGSVALHNLALASERIAPNPVTGIDVGITSTGTWQPAERRLTLTEATVAMKGARLQTRGVFEWAADHYLVDVTADLPVTACDAALSAIPSDLLDGVSGFSWDGNIGGHMALTVDSRKLADTHLTLSVADHCTFVMVPQLADLRRFRAPFTHRVLEPDDTWFEMETGPGTANWTPISEMSPFIQHAVLAHEDGGFFGHGGFAVWAIEGALKHNLQAGRYVQGASTITMQLAKNVFLHREKTLARKVQEVLLTWWLENAMSKKEILELYLNVIEYGPGIYGIRNATKHYFGVEPRDASLAQASFLANILPNPKLYHSNYESGLSPKMAGRMKSLITYMHSKGRVDATAVTEANEDIAAFKFVHAGEQPVPRAYVGTAAPLPYEGGTEGTPAADEAWDTIDRGDEDRAE